MKKDYQFNTGLFYAQFVLLAVLLGMLVDNIIADLSFPHTYASYGISDYLINYQGGFVRRGLLGEILYQIYRLHPFPFKTVIFAGETVTYILFLCLSLHVFIKHRWSFLPLIYPLVCVMGGILFYRRDFLIMLMVYGIYDLFFRYVANRRRCYLAILVLLTCLCILIYEPSFFLTVPLFFVVAYNTSSGGMLTRFFKSGGIVVLPILTMGLVSLWKGSATQAQEIWASWQPLFETYPEAGMNMEQLGYGVEWLGFKLPFAAKTHLHALFGNTLTIENLYYDALLLLAYPMIYFLVTRIPVNDFKARKFMPNSDAVTLSDGFCFQILAMLPMLTILSCDLGRTIPLCIYTTYFLVHLSKKYKLEIQFFDFLHAASIKIQTYIDNSPRLSSVGTYFLVLLLAPLRPYGSPSLKNTIIHKIITLFRQLL